MNKRPAENQKAGHLSPLLGQREYNDRVKAAASMEAGLEQQRNGHLLRAQDRHARRRG